MAAPNSSRDFQSAARQRLTTADFLLQWKYTLDATYLAGYTIECTLKALILEITPVEKQADTLKRITAGKSMHSPEILGAILKDLNCPIPLEIVKRFRRFSWSTNLRYESGRKPTGETTGFLKTAKKAYDWVEGMLP